MLDQIAAALGVKKGIALAALIGAFLAALIHRRLQSSDGAKRSWLELFLTMMVGFFASVYGTEPLLAYLEWAGKFEHGVAFFVGLFAMAIIDKLLSLIKTVDGEFIKSLFKR